MYKRQGHHPPDVQSAVVQHAEKPGGIDPHQPVGFGPAQGGRIQPVIVAARFEGRKALPDGGILHAGNPQPEHGDVYKRQAIGSDESDDAACPHLVDGLGKEVIVDQQVVPVIGAVTRCV